MCIHVDRCYAACVLHQLLPSHSNIDTTGSWYLVLNLQFTLQSSHCSRHYTVKRGLYTVTNVSWRSQLGSVQTRLHAAACDEKLKNTTSMWTPATVVYRLRTTRAIKVRAILQWNVLLKNANISNWKSPSTKRSKNNMNYNDPVIN